MQPPLPPPRSGKARWLPLALLAGAGLIIGYVLLHPPGKPAVKKPPAVAASSAVTPVTESLPLPQPVPDPALPPPPVAAVASELPPQLPVLVALPGGPVRLSETVAGGASRDVRVAPLKMGRTEVTVAQFREFVQRTGYDNPRWQNYPCESAGGRLPDWQDPGYAQRDESPVVCVSWADANAYTQWLSRETGQPYRLPTEAEWEYAARAGTSSRYWWGNEPDGSMVACQSCPPKVPTQPAGAASFPANPFGLFETLGNVREWTCSRYESYASPAAESCGNVVEAAQVAVRGGSWQQTAEALQADHREAYEPYRRNVWTGFRVVQDLRNP